ncbi:MAG TPA: Mut7-C RNAse domain-containing protein [Thermoplasmata archaeon]|nr:Mut7-C RNAse domain-containing protein [Thermoplasmata archaeon]
MRLLCDHMLGTLAKWLRFMGYDTAYPGPLNDTELLVLAEREDRILLTRDKELASRSPDAIRVRSDDLEEQIREVATRLGLGLVDPLSRCSLCNTVLVEARADEVGDRVPDGVRARHDKFWRCPSCGKVYWQGSHWDRMVERLNRLPLRHER